MGRLRRDHHFYGVGLGAGLGTAAFVLGIHSRRATQRLILERPLIAVVGPVCRPTTLSILHLSDLHLTRRTPMLSQLNKYLTALEYDLILCSGDLADDEPGRELALELLRQLEAPLGVYAVPGNHDHHSYSFLDMLRSTVNEPFGGPISKGSDFRFDPFAVEIERAGVRLLRNQNALIPLPEGDLWLLGLDDEHSGHSDLKATLAGIPEVALKVMLTHSPDAFPAAAAAGVCLVLAGHTHGGQIVLPLVGALQTRSELKARRPSGLFRQGGSQLYINRGAGASVPFRLNCPPELALIELHIRPL